MSDVSLLRNRSNRRGAALERDPEALWLIPAAAIVLTVWIIAILAAEVNGTDTMPLVLGYAGDAISALPALFAVALIAGCARAIRRGERRPLTLLMAGMTIELRSPWRFAACFGAPVLMVILLGAFGTLKTLLPVYAPFAHDALFLRVDRALFAGMDPWRITHAIIGGDTATLVLDRLYTAWIGLLPIAIIAFALFAPKPERARFFLAMILTWALLGVVGAYLGTSAGPAFLHQLGHPDAAALDGLMQRLRATDAAAAPRGLDAIQWQATLWQAHQQRDLSFGMGISAMPSLHNAITVLYVFAAFRFGRWQGWIAAGFAWVVFVGSVHLGWHYAIDGIASAVAVASIWAGVDRYIRNSGYDKLVTLPAARAAAGAARSA